MGVEMIFNVRGWDSQNNYSEAEDGDEAILVEVDDTPHFLGPSSGDINSPLRQMVESGLIAPEDAEDWAYGCPPMIDLWDRTTGYYLGRKSQGTYDFS